MGRPKKDAGIELTPEETAFQVVLRMANFSINKIDIKFIYNAAILIKEKGADVSLQELFQFLVKDES